MSPVPIVQLDRPAIEQWWLARHPRLARVLEWMESVEDWTLDESPDVADALYPLLARLDSAEQEDIEMRQEELFAILAYVSSPRAIRILEWLDERFDDDLMIRLVELAQQLPEDECSRHMLDRLQSLKSLQLLGQVFTPSRTRRIAELLKRG